MSLFDSVAFPKHKRNVFQYHPERVFTAQFGQLIPIFCEEVLPGDTHQIRTDLFARAMPMLAPLMHRVNIYTHYFFVPNRLVWDDWKDFITGGEDGTAKPIHPYVNISGKYRANGSLADYFGVHTIEDPAQNVGSIKISALPFRAYNLIWNEYYRDQNLQEEIEFSKESGYDQRTPKDILLRNWEKDYFTSALPWTQRGPEATGLLHGENDVYLKMEDDVALNYNKVVSAESAYEDYVNGNIQYSERVLEAMDDGGENPKVALDPNGAWAVSSEGSYFAVNELRRTIALQRWLEANARGGSRYIEQIFSHWGITSSDARLQRPEYLGGGRQPLSISEVLQTSQSTADSSLGDMAGHGISAASTKQFRRFFEEHGLIIGIMSIMPKSSYSTGTRRFLTKFDRFDYAFPEFANLGEQEVWNSEIYTDFRPGVVNQVGPESGTFGYQSRYCEYKYVPNTIHGFMRNGALSSWTLSRLFANKPKLNSEFIDCDNNEEQLWRIFASDDELQFIIQSHTDWKAVRILPKHVIPSL